MKFYLAARFDERETVRQLHRKLRELGHEITLDWTTHDPLARYGDLPDKARAYAIEDVQGVVEADVFIFLTGPTVGTGSHTELGVAIRERVTTGKPRIFVVGEYTSRSIMYFHPVVERRADFDAVLTELDVLKK